MATGDQTDCVRRLLALLPPWFVPGGSSILSAVLHAPAYVLSFCCSLVAFSQTQTRISTATGGWLDLIAYDFFGYQIQRGPREEDTAFRQRIASQILPAAGSRQALFDALESLTGNPPVIADPWSPATMGTFSVGMGAYCVGTLAYGQAGSYGSNQMPGEFFITAKRPNDGVHAATDAQIYARIASIIPAGSRAWVALSD